MFDADILLRVRAGADAIGLQMTAHAPMRLVAFAPDRYADAEGSCEVAFKRDDKGGVNGLLLNLAGVDRAAKRVVWTVPAAK
jgi:hypothetical protein